MDLFTHALLGASVARTTAVIAPQRMPLHARERLVLGAAAAAFPDIDFAGFLIDPLVFLADWHQGPTHSVVMLPLWAVLIAALSVVLTKRRAVFADAVIVSALGLASHIAADLITVYGTMVFHPLSRWRPSLGTTFVIDPVFTAIILAGLIASLWSGRRRVAGASLAVLIGYVAGQGWLQQRALEIAGASIKARGLAPQQLSALPQPFSPFNWKLIASDETLHHEAYINLLGHAPLVWPLPGLRLFHDMAGLFVLPHNSIGRCVIAMAVGRNCVR